MDGNTPEGMTSPDSSSTPTPPIPDARAVVYEATCAQCGTRVRATWEGLHLGGWTCLPRPEQGLPSQWFCPADVHGLERVP